MTSFDMDYRIGYVYRLFFGHAPSGDHGSRFARQDVVVTDASDDTLSGYMANASVDIRTSQIGGDPDEAVEDEVRIKDRVVEVRKSAVVMRRELGKAGDDVTVAKDRSGQFTDDGGDD